MCSSIGPITVRVSRTPPVEPGALMMRAAWSPREVTPTRPRDSPARAEPCAPRARTCSASPSRRATNNGSVASGVRSRGEIPVPPVVTTSRHPFSSASLKAPPTESIPSGTTVTGSTLSQLHPSSASNEAAKGPDRSKAAPAAQRSETVMMRALISSTQSILSRSDQRSRRPVLGISH